MLRSAYSRTGGGEIDTGRVVPEKNFRARDERRRPWLRRMGAVPAEKYHLQVSVRISTCDPKKPAFRT
jgi:hypothetical protein